MIAELFAVSMVGDPAETPPGVPEDLDCSETVEIPMARSGDEITRTIVVSKAWYEHQQYVSERLENFIEAHSIEESDWVHFAGITATEETVCDQHRLAIKVDVTDVERARAAFGDSFGGIELVIEEGDPGMPTDGAGESNDGLDGAIDRDGG